MIISDKTYADNTYVMAIINLTPDSFYAPSRASADDVLFRAERAEKEGAAILDLGAQSTRPGYKEVPFEEELRRLERPLYEIKRNFSLPVSVDTYFPQVAEAAFELGADMLNDVWGLTREGMAQTVAKYGKSVCIMHNSPTLLVGDDVFPPVLSFLNSAVKKALSAGVDRDKICLDGGIGFAKDAKQSMQLLNGYERLSSLGYPLLLGASRKSLFGGDAAGRLNATLVATRSAARKKILFVRVHDVAENVRVIKEEYERN